MWPNRSLFASSSRRASSASAPRSGTLPVGCHGLRPRRNSTSALYTLPMPARFRWSSRASPMGRSGSAPSRRTASSRSQSGPSRSGPRCPVTRGSSLVRISSTTPSWYPTACHSSLASSSLIRWLSRSRSAAGRTRQLPSIFRWVWTVRPLLVLVSRCFPRETVSVTTSPDRSAVASRGTRKSLRVSTFPASASCRRRAVYQTTFSLGHDPSVRQVNAGALTAGNRRAGRKGRGGRWRGIRCPDTRSLDSHLPGS